MLLALQRPDTLIKDMCVPTAEITKQMGILHIIANFSASFDPNKEQICGFTLVLFLQGYFPPQ